jgi:hypothetical protein
MVLFWYCFRDKMVLERRGDEMDYFLLDLGCYVNGITVINEVNTPVRTGLPEAP